MYKAKYKAGIIYYEDESFTTRTIEFYGQFITVAKNKYVHINGTHLAIPANLGLYYSRDYEYYIEVMQDSVTLGVFDE